MTWSLYRSEPFLTTAYYVHTGCMGVKILVDAESSGYLPVRARTYVSPTGDFSFSLYFRGGGEIGFTAPHLPFQALLRVRAPPSLGPLCFVLLYSPRSMNGLYKAHAINSAVPGTGRWDNNAAQIPYRQTPRSSLSNFFFW